MAARRKSRGKHSSLSAREAAHQHRSRNDIRASISPATKIGSVFKPLSEPDVNRIHLAALDLLSTIGIAQPTPHIAEIALKHGCEMNEQGRLLFPSSLVEDLLDKAAKKFIVHGRVKAFDFEARNGNLNFCTGGAAVSMLDINQRSYRPSTLTDLYDLARLCDTLENIQWFARPVVATEIDDLFNLDVNTVYACAAGTQKHIASSFTNGDHLYKILPLLDKLSYGSNHFRKRPFCTVHATTIVSPLTFAKDSLDVACAAVDIGMPVHVQTGPQAGATAPAALAGTLVQGCAESLGSLSIINMLKPGHPTVIGNWAFVSDLRTGAFSGGGAEQALLGAASGQMSAFYGIPGGMGAGMSDSKVPDNQAGFEKALTIMAAALSGGGFVYESAGMLASLLGCSFESMLIDNDMLSNIRRIAKGIEVSDESLSLSVVADTVNGPGHYLGHPQTMALMETEYIYPDQADRKSPDDWNQAGKNDAWDRARTRAREILSCHYPVYIDDKTDNLIREHYPIQLTPVSTHKGK